MTEASNEQVTMAENTLSNIQQFEFPTVYQEYYQIEVITNDKQSYSSDAEYSTIPLYQLLDQIVLDKYSDFHGGVKVASIPAQDSAHSKLEPWSNVSDVYVQKKEASFLGSLLKLIKSKETDEEEEEEEEKSDPTPKDILISRMKNILFPEVLTYRLGCVNNRIYVFFQPDGSIRFDIMPRSDLDKVMHQIQEKLYKDSIKTFIELIIKAIDEDNADGKFSMHMAAHLSADAFDTERDEFLAIVTPNNKTIIMMGFFYNRFYG
ncbi:unnamed protein product [Adineta steineri]|uniref:Uncharacterized protein n=1 Tax=Adineta steineri TaxID=433720 RepID=A0A815SXA4_9BILA|nr:unnamed protein product [Adineta steineri]CAF1495665.1 unnamed protein product [Adineta steineri]CAF1510505.1 unnamed protein product [Adineta steineri]